MRKTTALGLLLLFLLLGIAACRPATAQPQNVASSTVTGAGLSATSTPAPDLPVPGEPVETAPPGLTPHEIATLQSLRLVDEYPLYTLRYYGAYQAPETTLQTQSTPAWGCSLFAALGDPHNRLYGRNFDWYYSPAVLLYTDPPDAYASVSMVDIAYFAFPQTDMKQLAEINLAGRTSLLEAPYLPFDGMNEHGLVIGMAAVAPGDVPPDPAKPHAGSLEIMRHVLDQARTVEEGLEILTAYNLDFAGGPPLHYLLADRSGQAALLEHAEGEIHISYNTHAWLQATNFLVAAESEPGGRCRRYDHIQDLLSSAGGRLDPAGALDLLEAVSQVNTQWSLVYDMSSLQLQVVMGGEFSAAHSFSFSQLGSP